MDNKYCYGSPACDEDVCRCEEWELEEHEATLPKHMRKVVKDALDFNRELCERQSQ